MTAGVKERLGKVPMVQKTNYFTEKKHDRAEGNTVEEIYWKSHLGITEYNHHHLHSLYPYFNI